MALKFHAYDQNFVASVRQGGPDAHGLPAERSISDGRGNPCRSCLKDIPRNTEMLILAACPFPELQPYAETGPIFLCAQDCTPYSGAAIPMILTTSPDYLLKAYNAHNRIIYGTGTVLPAAELAPYAKALFTDHNVAYVDVRSSRNNCFQTRITRS